MARICPTAFFLYTSTDVRTAFSTTSDAHKHTREKGEKTRERFFLLFLCLFPSHLYDAVIIRRWSQRGRQTSQRRRQGYKSCCCCFFPHPSSSSRAPVFPPLIYVYVIWQGKYGHFRRLNKTFSFATWERVKKSRTFSSPVKSLLNSLLRENRISRPGWIIISSEIGWLESRTAAAALA